MVILQTVSLKRDSEGSRKGFVVECRPVDSSNSRNNKVSRSKKFFCQGFDDAEAKAKALRFAFSTEGFVAFRRFLFGLKEEGSSDSSTSGASGAGSAGDNRSSRRSKRRKRNKNMNTFVCVRINGLNGLRFAAAVGEAGDGTIRSVSFRGGEGNESGTSVEDAIEKAVGFLKGPGLRSRSGNHRVHQVEVSSLDGMPKMACRYCGEQLGRSSADAQFEKQISEDNICSACLKVEREEIVVIRMDEQGEYREMLLKDIWTGSKFAKITAEESICCVCGCEDNEDLEAMIQPCTCSGHLAVAHPTCVIASVASSRFCNKQAATSCKVCGGMGTLDEVMTGIQTRTGVAEDGSSKPTDSTLSLRKKVTGDPNSRAVKRPRSALGGGNVGKKRSPLRISKEESGGQVIQGQLVQASQKDMAVSESEKLGVTLLGRRFNDAVASVPIKKRRIALVRSPSPPPRSPSPEHAEFKTLSVVCSTLEQEQEQGKMNAHRQQRVPENMCITRQEDFGEVYVSTDGNDTQFLEKCVEGNSNSLVSFPDKTVSNADFSGISMLAAAACTGNQGSTANSLEDVVARAQSPTSEGAKSPSLSLKDDMEIDFVENEQDGEPIPETQIQVEDSMEQIDTIKCDPFIALDDKKHVNEEQQIGDLSESQGHINAEVAGQSTELALGCNISKRLGLVVKDLDTIDSCPSRFSKDREKEEKGKLLRLDSGYLRDDRSHWDLNTMMDAWESPSEDPVTDPGPGLASELPVASLNTKDLGDSDGIEVQIAEAECKSDSRGLEQDMLSKGFHADQNIHKLNSPESLSAFEERADADSNISLGLQLDAAFGHQCVSGQELANRASLVINGAQSEASGAGNCLNLSIAPVKGFSVSTNYVCNEGDIGRHCGQGTSNDVSEIHQALQGDNHPDILVPQVNESRKIEHGLEHVGDHTVTVTDEIAAQENGPKFSLGPSHRVEHVKDQIQVGSGIGDQENGSSSESTHHNIDKEPRNSLSSRGQQHPTVEVNTLVDDEDIAIDESVCKVDATVLNDESVCMVVATMAIDESGCKAHVSVAVDDSICEGDDCVYVEERFCKGDETVAVHESTCEVGTSVAVDFSVSKVDAPVVNDETVSKVDAPVVNDETVSKVDAPVVNNETVSKVDAPVVNNETVSKVDAPVVNNETVNKVAAPPAVDNENICKVDAPAANNETVSKVDAPAVNEESVCMVDALVVNDESVFKVDALVVNDECVCKVDDSAAVDMCVFKVDDSVAVDKNVCKVNDSIVADESFSKTEVSVAVDERVCKVETSLATDDSVCKVDSPVPVDESGRMVDASVAVIETCTHSEKSEILEDKLEKGSREMAMEDACGYDYDEDDEDDELVSDTERLMEEQADDDSQYEDGEFRETMPHDWGEEIGEELEAEHVDYGYSDCRDADDLAIGTDERFSMSFQAESERKGEDHVDTEDIEPVWDDVQQAEMGEKGIHIHQVLHDKRFGEVTRVQLHKNGNSKADEIATVINMEDMSEKEKHKDDLKSVKLAGENEEPFLEVGQQSILDHHEIVELGEVKHTTSSKQKFSGWDQLPEGFISAEEALKSVRDYSAKRSQGLGWAGSSGRDSLGRMGSMAARGLPLRLERPRPSDLVHGRDGVYTPGSREENLDTSPRFASRGLGRGRTVGRGGSLRGLHSRGRGDPWRDSSNGQWGPSRHHSPGYYGGPLDFGPLGPTNAAAVAAAKVESSGFVVAPDGTIVKAGGTGPTARGGMHPVMGVSRPGRGTITGRGSSVDMEGNMNFGMQMGIGPGRGLSTSPDTGVNLGRGRAGGFDSDIVGPGRRGGQERYRGPLYGNSRLDPSLDDSPHRSMPSVDLRFSRRDRSFSPPLRRGSPHLRRGSPHLSFSPPLRRGSPHLRRVSPNLRRVSPSYTHLRRGSPPHTSRSRTKSPSRSRTRSPRLWSSPRGRTFSGMEGGSGSRRRSRSPPGLRSEARLDRLKSPPSHRAGIPGHAMRFVPSSRSQCSPPHVSKWSGDRRDAGHIRDHDYKRHFVPTRGLPGRMSPRGVHTSLRDSPGRSYSRSMHAEFGSDTRRSRREENNDGRWKQSERYGSVHSVRSVEIGSEVRRPRYEEDGGYRARSSRAKDATELQGRGSPRAGDKDRDDRAGSTSSRRERSREEDKSHLKYSRDCRSRGSFKSSSTREGDDDVAPRRRRPS
eukprot:Gb_11517 [translate_table: standard]